MKIYRLNMTVYTFWYTQDRDGYIHKEKFFAKKENAEKWMNEHKTFCYNRDNEVATEKYQMPRFEIEEIEIDDF